MLAVLGGEFTTLCSLLDREADPTTGEVEVDDLDPQLLSWRNNLLGRIDMVC